MNKSKKLFARALYLVFALALVAGLTLVAAPPPDEVAAHPGDITSYRARLTDRGEGVVTWDDITAAEGAYSVKLDVPAVTDGAAYSFRFLPSDPPRMAPESGNTKSGVPPAAGFPLSELASASDINVWLNLSVAAPTPYVNLFLYVPGAPSYPLTKAAGECLMSGISQWDEGLDFPQQGWTLYVMEGTQMSPVDGTANVGTWELYEPDDLWYSVGAGAPKPGEDLAWWKTNYPNGIVLGAMIMHGMYNDDQLPCNVDDFSITHTPDDGSAVTDTYVFEPQIDRLLPSVARDVKGAVQKFNANSINPDWVTGWEIYPVVNLGASDISVIDGGKPAWQIIGGADDTGTGTHADWIAIRSLERGDCHIKVKINFNGDTDDDRYIWGEKKWGEISRSELDVNLDVDGLQHERTITCGLDGQGDIMVEQEWIEETVWADFYWGSIDVIEEYTAGHALVHWWAINDTAANQDVIHDLMDALETGNDGWSACGKYDPDVTPFDILDALATAEPPDSDVAWWKDELGAPVAAPEWYTQTETEDDWPGELRGHTWAHLGVKLPEDPDNAGTFLDVDLIIVTLAEYPHDYSGENAVSVQMGKKHYSITIPPPPEQIKVPQVRWAAEIIVLEKDWGEEFSGNVVVFALQGDSVGSLEATYSDDISASDAETVITTVQSDGVARCLLQSQPQGQADVKAALYADIYPPGGDSFPEAMDALTEVTPQNHDFLVYFLALEDVTVDPDLSELEEIDAGVSANVTVKVKGWFTSASLPGTNRGPVLGDDGITYVRPAGRYVLPDDWAALAGSDLATSNKASRPQYDLMNTPGDGVVSTAELGPYDSGVRTTTIPGVAEAPCIGPFNALQPWSNFDAVTLDPVNRWIATASVDSSLTPDYLRNTVVPDATIDWYDCPMPQALVTFDVDDTEVLAALDKGDVFVDGTSFTAPFYAVEIPSHSLIPVAGYFWDSWGLTVDITIDGPYDFWDDLGVTPNHADILEVYSDNHGYAGVTIVGTGLANECVTLDVIADFPVMAAKYSAVDTATEVCWGLPIEHLNADFEVSDRTGEATTDVPLTISFYGLRGAGTGDPWTMGGTEPYVKAEWDFDGDGTIDATIEATTSDATLVTQTFNFTAASSYSPWLRVTDTNGLVDICEKPDYIVLTGEEPPAEFPLCDIDESGTVNIADFVLFATSYGLSLGDVGYDGRCDLNESNGVDILDFVIFAQCWAVEA